MWHCHSLVLNLIVNVNVGMSVLFCSSAVLDARVGHTMNILSPFISVLCHSDWLPWWALSASWCCPSRLCVVFSPASIWQCSLHYLFLPRLLGMSVWQAEWRLWWRAAWHYFSLRAFSVIGGCIPHDPPPDRITHTCRQMETCLMSKGIFFKGLQEQMPTYKL